ncbi:ATP-dependent helicase, partial [Clostridium sporogenes]
MNFKPWNYQQYSINHIIDHSAAGLFLDMGMGKTVSTLTAIDDLLFLGESEKILVIAPLRVAEDTWS